MKILLRSGFITQIYSFSDKSNFKSLYELSIQGKELIIYLQNFDVLSNFDPIQSKKIDLEIEKDQEKSSVKTYKKSLFKFVKNNFDSFNRLKIFSYLSDVKDNNLNSIVKNFDYDQKYIILKNETINIFSPKELLYEFNNFLTLSIFNFKESSVIENSIKIKTKLETFYISPLIINSSEDDFYMLPSIKLNKYILFDPLLTNNKRSVSKIKLEKINCSYNNVLNLFSNYNLELSSIYILIFFYQFFGREGSLKNTITLSDCVKDLLNLKLKSLPNPVDKKAEIFPSEDSSESFLQLQQFYSKVNANSLLDEIIC